MVNYCCVAGCGRNSRINKHLYYYSVPKESNRQEQWLLAAGREDLLKKTPDKRVMHRFCSRHFSPSSFKNKHLCSDAVPTMCLPGSELQEKTKPVHSNISCDNCGNSISGFRYKCVLCTNYDLCSKCEMTEVHSQHYMLRIPTPANFKTVEQMVKKWQQLYIENDVRDDSSDDEPITKYVSKSYDSGVDLDEDIKESIRREVDRVLMLEKCDDHKEKQTPGIRKRPAGYKKAAKKQKLDMTTDMTEFFGNPPEVVFVDEIHSVAPSHMMDVKSESLADLQSNDPSLPMLQMKLSDDVSELMMEVTDQKAMF